MSENIEYVFSWINNFINNIQGFITNLSKLFTGLGDIGKGIIGGLAILSGALYGGIQAVANAINNLTNMGDYIYEGIKWFTDKVVNFLINIPSTIIYAGRLFWKTTVIAVSMVHNTLADWWNALADTIELSIGSINSFIESFRNSVNAWFTSLAEKMRSKIKETLMIDLAVYFTWKWGEKSIEKQRLFGIISIPIVFGASMFTGYVIGEVIDRILPTPSTNPFEIVPPIRIPQLNIKRMEKININIEEVEKTMPMYYSGIRIDKIGEQTTYKKIYDITTHESWISQEYITSKIYKSLTSEEISEETSISQGE